MARETIQGVKNTYEAQITGYREAFISYVGAMHGMMLDKDRTDAQKVEMVLAMTTEMLISAGRLLADEG